jgi:hypothetical protein
MYSTLAAGADRMDSVYEVLNKSWKSTCRILFGEELGELSEFKEYLSEPLVGQFFESCYSGKKIWVGSDKYNPDSRFFDFSSEISKYTKILSEPMRLDEIKDIDSLVDALKEKLVYAGCKSFGNSKNVVNSDSIMDSSNILNSSRIIRSKYVAYSYMMQYNEHCFGSTSSGESTHIARCFYNNSLSRCFEICGTIKASDSYFSYNIWSCNDCIFSFNLRSKRYMIANIQLRKERYMELKKKLLGDIADELKGKKRLSLSILDLVNEVGK